MIPNLFLVGAQKSGTTYVHNVLVKNKLASCGKTKEIHFFIRRESKIKEGIEGYLLNFRDSPESKYLIDSSTSYFLPNDPKIDRYPSKQIYNFNKNAKVFAVIRNPIERYESAYNHHILKGNIEITDEIDEISDKHFLLDIGRYDESITQWKEYFPQIKILTYDSLTSSRDLFFKELFEFLELDTTPKNLLLEFRSNDTNTRFEKNKNLSLSSKIQLTTRSKDFLKDYYRESILNTEKLVNQDLSHWIK